MFDDFDMDVHCEELFYQEGLMTYSEYLDYVYDFEDEKYAFYDYKLRRKEPLPYKGLDA